MKNLVLIVHVSAQQRISDQLRDMDQVSGFTFSHVEGHGVQAEHDPFLSTRDKVVGYTPRVRVDVLLEDADVEAVIAALGSADDGSGGLGIYWVTAVEQQGRL